MMALEFACHVGKMTATTEPNVLVQERHHVQPSTSKTVLSKNLNLEVGDAAVRIPTLFEERIYSSVEHPSLRCISSIRLVCLTESEASNTNNQP
jgi:hypothetical protein